MTKDFDDLLQAFTANKVRFLVVGAYALALHGRPRLTKDLDVCVEPAPENAKRVIAALRDFGAPMSQIAEVDFAKPGAVFQIGLPPCRIDVLTQLTGVGFPEAWEDRQIGSLGSCEVPFLGKKSFIKNKRAAGRHQDLADAEEIGRASCRERV